MKTFYNMCEEGHTGQEIMNTGEKITIAIDFMRSWLWPSLEYRKSQLQGLVNQARN